MTSIRPQADALPSRGASVVAVVGGGPAGLMAAEVLARGGAAVTVYERMPSVGRKFLLAGRGGLNLTHGEELEAFLARYGDGTPRLRAAIEAFPPAALRAWCEGLGQATFVGSSGRVFPASFKTSPLLRAWLSRLAALGVAFRPRHRWEGFTTEGRLRFAAPDGSVEVAAHAAVLALGGASWPRLGSDGAWVECLSTLGVDVAPLRPSNCGVLVPWSDLFRDRFEGVPLKSVRLSFAGQAVRGDAVVTRLGLEGGAVYALSPPLREAVAASGEAVLHVDLRPDLDAAVLRARLEGPREKHSLSTVLRKALKLPPVAVALLHEAALGASRALGAHSPAELATLVKSVPVRVVGTAPLARAISSAGGVRFAALDGAFMLRCRPGIFVAGEMLDWEAPTGGYLLQACFATAVAAAEGALNYLGAPGTDPDA